MSSLPRPGKVAGRAVARRGRGGERVLGDHRREGIPAPVGHAGALEGPLGAAAAAAAVELGQLWKRRSRRRFRKPDLSAVVHSADSLQLPPLYKQFKLHQQGVNFKLVERLGAKKYPI